VDDGRGAPARNAKIRCVTVDPPDPDWYLDNVILPAGQGPLAARQAAWLGLAANARVHACASAADLVELALRQGFVATRAQARDLGMPDADVRRLVRRGVWSAPRRGVLAVVPLSDDSNAALAAAAAALVRPGHVISHRSAVALLGLPVLHRPAHPELTATIPATSGARRNVTVYRARLPVADRTEWFGAAMTIVARTIVDLARVDRLQGLVAADAALHERLVTTSDLSRQLEGCAGWPGAARARDVLAAASSLAESPLETLTRLCLLDAGIPSPELQVRIGRDRVDMLWRHERVVVEADGRLKYRDDELWKEKRRQERIERLGFRVVRVLWADVVDHPDETAARVRAALRASRLAAGPTRI
jgi:very-short-patch-repair endonuclease